MDYINKISGHLPDAVLPADFSLNGKIYRFGKSKRCWAIGYEWEYKGKNFWRVKGGDWSSPESKFDFKSYEELDITKKEREYAEAKFFAIENVVKIENEEKRKSCVENSIKKLGSALIADDHPYIIKKKIKTYGVTQSDGLLQIPIYKNKRLSGLQYISQTGKKWFETGTEISGSYFPLKPINKAEFIYLAEGFGTSASIQEGTDFPVVCCFTANNLLKVAKELARPFGPFLVICADRDKINPQTGLRTGEAIAYQIVNSIRKSAVIFPHDDEEKIGDFNDLYVEQGIEALKERISIDKDAYLNSYFRKMEATGFTSYDETKGQSIYQYNDLLEYMSLKTPYWYFPDIHSFYIYNGRIYEQFHEQFIKQYAQQKFKPSPVNDAPRVNFLNLTKVNNCVRKSKIEKNDNNVVAFKNHLIDFSDVKNPKPLPHSPKHFITRLIPFNFNPDAKCPTYDQLLKNILDDQEYIDTVNEFLGWTLSSTGYVNFQNFMIFDGEGENGKSTLCRRFTHILGKVNTSSVSFNDIGRIRFSEEPLINSLLNIAEEEPPSVFKDTGYLKKITGGTPVNLEPKGKPVLNMDVRAKVILTYNKMPVLHDKTNGFQRRPIIIPFRFNLKDPENKNRVIKDIDRKLDLESEGIISRALEGYLRLMERGRFMELSNTKSRLQEMYRESDPVYEFVLDRIETDNDSHVWGNDIVKQIIEDNPDYDSKNKREILKSFRSALKSLGKMSQKDFRTNGFNGKDQKFPGIKIV